MAENENVLTNLLLLEEAEDEEMLLLCMHEENNADVHPMFKTRAEEGFYKVLIDRHLQKDDKKFRQFFRLNICQFNYVLDLIKDDIKTNSCNRVRFPITPDEKLAITLRYMATGESLHSLAFAFRVSPSYISKILQKTLPALSRKLMPIYLPSLSDEEKKLKAEQFKEKWKFPNCIGAVDGKHVRIVCPAKTGSLYFNYKDFFSIVLLAVVDANYKFIFIDVGSYGKEGDSGIFDKSNIGKAVRTGNIFPPPNKLPNSDKVLPYVFTGDEAFRLDKHMMKPFARPAARVDERKV